MSLAQLEKQIELANAAMARAAEKGAKSKNKAAIREELTQFAKVLAKSKARLRDFAAIRQQCDDFSACQNLPEQRPITGIDLQERRLADEYEDEDGSEKKSVFIPWLGKKQSEKLTEQIMEGRDEEEGSIFKKVHSFGSHMASVSSLGSQVFGSSQASGPRNTPFSATEARDGPDVSSLEYIAEKELQARENYIKASKEHQQLKKKGITEDSEEWKRSENHLKGCYAQIEYWESLNAKVARQSRGEVSTASGEDKNKASSMFARRNTFKTNGRIDVVNEEQKAREEYIEALTRHQSLIGKKVGTKSDEWLSSQAKVQECLTNLQYWENCLSSEVPPMA